MSKFITKYGAKTKSDLIKSKKDIRFLLIIINLILILSLVFNLYYFLTGSTIEIGILDSLVKTYSQEIRVVFKHFPLEG